MAELEDRDPRIAGKLEWFYTRYKTYLENFFRFRIGNSADCQDLVQDVFYRLNRNSQVLENLTEEGAQKAYLLSIANNLVTDRYRKKAIRSNFESREKHVQYAGVNEIDPQRELFSTRDIEVLKKVLEGLPESCRRAFVLNRFHYKTYNEIGQIMNLPVKKVERHIVKALSLLRQALGDSDNPAYRRKRK